MLSLAVFAFKLQEYYFPQINETSEEILVCDDITEKCVSYQTAVDKCGYKDLVDSSETDPANVTADNDVTSTIPSDHTAEVTSIDNIETVTSVDSDRHTTTLTDVILEATIEDDMRATKTAIAICNNSTGNNISNTSATDNCVKSTYKHVNFITTKEQNGAATPVQGKIKITSKDTVSFTNNTERSERSPEISTPWMHKESNVYFFKYSNIQSNRDADKGIGCNENASDYETVDLNISKLTKVSGSFSKESSITGSPSKNDTYLRY